MTDKQLYILIGVGALGMMILSAKAGGAAQAVGEAVSPASRHNLVYRGFNAVGDIFDDGVDNDSGTVGTWVYDFFHPEG